MTTRFFTFMASPTGRCARIAAGGALIPAGLRGRRVLAAIGAVPLLAGALDVCLAAPLFGRPLTGAALRVQLGAPDRAPLVPRRGVAFTDSVSA